MTRIECRTDIPYRIEIAGAWMDQPYCSRLFPGSVITASLEPTHQFELKSGMATSTREVISKVWPGRMPKPPKEGPGFTQTAYAQYLFAAELQLGMPKEKISGSQDHFGIMLTGLNRLVYNGGYIPEEIQNMDWECTLSWLERVISLVHSGPRPTEYNPYRASKPTKEKVQLLAQTTEECWGAILRKNISDLGHFIKENLKAQLAIFPAMAGPENVRSRMAKYNHDTYGTKFVGAGGGGYMIVVSRDPVPDGIKIRIRRE